jgi:hypothetical protein
VELNLKHSMKKKTLCVMTRLKKEKIMLRWTKRSPYIVNEIFPKQRTICWPQSKMVGKMMKTRWN